MPSPVDLMGHSRGGHIAFRVAQQRPDLLRRLVLAEPGGDLDASLDPAAVPVPHARAARFTASAEKVAAGDIDGGLKIFFDGIDGDGAWARLPAAPKQQLRDNAFTLIGQIGENRRPYTRPTRNRSGLRRCSSAAPTPGAPCPRCCARWPRIFPAQRPR